MIRLNQKQIARLTASANVEVVRDINSISVYEDVIFINGNWSITRSIGTIEEGVTTAIKEYCSNVNIEFEYESTYSAWCN